MSIVSEQTDITEELPILWCVWHCPDLFKEGAASRDMDRLSKELTRPVEDIKTIKTLWTVRKLLPSLGKLPANVMMGFFRKGYTPFWEDINFKHGGRIVFILIPSPDVEAFLTELLAQIIGGYADFHLSGTTDGETKPLICGVRIQRKETKSDSHLKIELWCTNYDRLLAIQRYFYAIAVQKFSLPLSDSDVVKFKF